MCSCMCVFVCMWVNVLFAIPHYQGTAISLISAALLWVCACVCVRGLCAPFTFYPFWRSDICDFAISKNKQVTEGWSDRRTDPHIHLNASKQRNFVVLCIHTEVHCFLQDLGNCQYSRFQYVKGQKDQHFNNLWPFRLHTVIGYASNRIPPIMKAVFESHERIFHGFIY